MEKVIDEQRLLLDAIRDGIREGVKQRFAGTYNNPLDKLITGVVESNAPALRGILDEAMKAALADAELRQQIGQQVRHKLAGLLVARFGGELEKQVNVLKSDPTTRARITLAIEEIVKERSQATA